MHWRKIQGDGSQGRKHGCSKSKKGQDQNKKQAHSDDTKHSIINQPGGKVSLEQAARVLPRSMYEPEQFSGVIHRMLDPKTVILIFASGKIVCAGAKQEDAIHRSVNSIHSELEQKNLMVYEQ